MAHGGGDRSFAIQNNCTISIDTQFDINLCPACHIVIPRPEERWPQIAQTTTTVLTNGVTDSVIAVIAFSAA